MNTPVNLYLGSLSESITSGVNAAMGVLEPFVPYVIAILIFFIGKCVAGKIRDILVKLLNKTSLDEKFGKLIGNEGGATKLIATIAYSLLLLFVVILALSMAGMNEAVAPLRDMFNSFTGFIPGAFGAAVLGFIAFFGAKIIKNLIESVLIGARVDERLGSKSGTPIASGLSVAAFSFILLVFIPQILTKLGLTQISEPIAGITASILAAVPNVIIAVIVFAIGFLIAQIAQKLIKSLLDASGVNAYPAKMGISGVPEEGSRSISSVVSYLVMISIVVVIVSQSIELLKLPLLTELTGGFVDGYFNVLVAILIFGFGLIASKFAFEKLEGGNLLLAKVARIAILVMTSVVALQRSGIAPGLTGYPFIAAISALAFAGGVGGAIALGLGGKDYVARWFDRKG